MTTKANLAPSSLPSDLVALRARLTAAGIAFEDVSWQQARGVKVRGTVNGEGAELYAWYRENETWDGGVVWDSGETDGGGLTGAEDAYDYLTVWS